MQVPVFTSAAEILARLKTVDSDVSGLNANTLQGYQASAFALAGHTHSYQAANANLTALSGLTGAADKLNYFTGVGAMALADFTTFGRSLAGAADAAAGRTALALGTMATQAETDYALLAGRAGGQSLIGGTASGNSLTLRSSSHATKGKVIFGNAGTTAYDEVNERFGVGTASPTSKFQVLTAGSTSPAYGTDEVFSIVNNSLFNSNAGFAVAAGSSGIGNFYFGKVGAYFQGIVAYDNATNAMHFSTNTSRKMTILSGGNVGIGTQTPATRLDAADTNASTSAIQNALTMRTTHASTAAAGFGVGFRAGLKSSTTDDQDAGRIAVRWNDATHASRQADMVFSAWYTSTEREFMRGRAGSAAPMIGFLGAAPIAKPTITGSRGANAALADLLTQMANYGLIVDSTTV